MVCTERSHQCKDVYLRLLTPNQGSLPSDQHSLHACTYMWLSKGRHVFCCSALCCFDLHTTFITSIQIQKLDIIMKIFTNLDLLKTIGIELSNFADVIISISEKFLPEKDIPYHNLGHGIECLQFVILHYYQNR